MEVSGEDLLEALTPPRAFGIVAPGVFRANAFSMQTFPFVETLNLKSVAYLSPELPPRHVKDFLERNNVQFVHHSLKLWRPEVTWKPLSDELVKDTLEFILDKGNHPVMIMCSAGIHETGIVVACLRKLMLWDLTSILHEYRSFAGGKARDSNELFIELFDTDLVTLPEHIPDWFIDNLRMTNEEERNRKTMEDPSASKPAFLKYYFSPKDAPLISPGTTYDKKKTIINDED